MIGDRIGGDSFHAGDAGEQAGGDFRVGVSQRGDGAGRGAGGTFADSTPEGRTQGPGSCPPAIRAAASRKASHPALGPPPMPKFGPRIFSAWLIVPDIACSE